MAVYAIQVKPYSAFAFPELADVAGGGLNIPVTGFVDGINEIETSTALIQIFQNLKAASDGTLWKPTTDGGIKALSVPQQGKDTTTLDSYFISLCCLQSTLGHIAQQIFAIDALAPFQSNLFPRLQKTQYTNSTDNLGAWQMELKPDSGAFTYINALEIKLGIVAELDVWYLALVKQDPPGTIPVRVWPTDQNLVDTLGYVFSPFSSLLPPPLYPPSGAQCDRQNQRPLRPFPPSSCAPPNSGCESSCYFPIRKYPGCCFTRINYPLLRRS